MSKSIKHILVIRLSAMGDVAMTVPVIRAFKHQHPQIKLTVLTREVFTPFFKDLDNVTIYNADVKGKHKGIFGLYQLAKEIKQLKIDAIADLHNVLRSNILKIFLYGKPIAQIDKGRAEKKALIKGTNFNPLKSTHQRYADVFEKLGFDVDLSNPKFPKPKPLHNSLSNLMKSNSEASIGIAPFAAFEGKTYPLSMMEKVISQLPKSYNIMLFGGGQKEIKQLDILASKFDNVTNLAGQFFLEDEMAIISNLDLMVSMDSGNAHIAAMLGIPVITIWGVTHPYAGFAPFFQPIDNAILADRSQFPKIPTSIYGNKFPEGYEHAMTTVMPEQIAEKIKMML